jgi:hypothetical protein
LRNKSETGRPEYLPPELDLTRRFRLAEVPDLREVKLAPQTFDISAAAEKKLGLIEELKRVQAAAPTRALGWLGEYVEQKFQLRGLGYGLRILRPESHYLPWDRLVIGNQNMYRTQIKYTTMVVGFSYLIVVKKNSGQPYKRGEFDILTVVTPAPEYEPDESEAWYIMPFDVIAKRNCITFPRERSPHSCRVTKYRDRWDLFA